MSIVPHAVPPLPSRPLIDACSRCASPLAGAYCHACGAQINGARLAPRALFDSAGRRVGWMFGRLVRTMFDLTIRPAEVCWIYLSGHRDRYTAPLPYAAFVLILERVVAWSLQRLSGLLDRPGAALLIPPSVFGWLAHLPTLIVAVVIWRVFFRGSGYNLAEMMAIALYCFGHFIVLWTAFTVLMSLLPIQELSLVRWSLVLQLVIGLAYVTWAGRGIFRENAALVALKIGVSVAVPVEILIAVDSLLSRR